MPETTSDADQNWAARQVTAMDAALEEGNTRAALQAALRIERSNWTEPDVVEELPAVVSDIERERELDVPDVVTSTAAINDGWCRVFAERVYKQLGRPESVSIESDGVNHTWLEHDDLCYDVDCHEGKPHPSMLPVYTGE